jgi:hypothetical protein
MTKFTYPHVGITTKALQRRTAATAESSATTLLAPFMCSKGPSNQLVPIDTMADFINTFGAMDYSKSYQRQILNIGNWLASGGRVLACRLTTTADALVKSMFLHSYTPTGATTDDKAITKWYEWAITGKDNVLYVHSESPDALTIKLQSYNYTDDTSTKTDGLDLLVTVATKIYRIRIAGTKDNTYTNITVDDTHKTAFTDSGLPTSMFSSIGSLDAKVSSASKTIIVYTSAYSLDTGITIDYPTIASSFVSASNVAIDTTSATTAGYQGTIGGIKFAASAPYEGSFYNDIQVQIQTSELQTNTKTNVKSMYFTITVQYTQNGTTVALEKFKNIAFDKLYTIDSMSEYVKNIKIINSSTGTEITSLDDTASATLLATFKSSQVANLIVTTKALDGAMNIESVLVSQLREILKKPLETPFDVMIDCGYTKQTKLDLIELFCSLTDNIETTVRNDAFLYLTDYVVVDSNTGRSDLDDTEIAIDDLRPNTINGQSCDYSNMEVIDQYATVQDIYSENSGKEVYVPLTYFVAGLVPANDAVNGPQWPVAGLTRGVIKNAIWINHIPTASEKQAHYDSHLNYAEKDDRGTCFMCQLTGTLDDTALKFTNNSRALLKMKKQLTLIARNYLHEFNDRLTKTNLLNALNTYLSNWIQNRTLSYGSVTLTDSTEDQTLSDEEIEIGLTVKFTGTIEVISIGIIVQ